MEKGLTAHPKEEDKFSKGLDVYEGGSREPAGESGLASSNLLLRSV